MQQLRMVIDHHHQIEKQELQVGQGQVTAGQRRQRFVVSDDIVTEVPHGSPNKRRQGVGTRNQAGAQKSE